VKTCDDCRFCIKKDYGYSNYTVEGTDVNCLKNANPAMPFDQAWGENPQLSFAENCSSFEAGTAVGVDCDQDLGDLVNYSDDPEIKELLASWDSKP